MRLITLTTALLAALALLPAAASASARQYALFQDEALITDNGATRGPTLDEVKGLGADMIKVQLNWATVAPGGRTKPKGFDGRDPSQYPGWGRYDDTIAAIKAHGFKVMVALAPPAPGWATPTRGDREGVTRPNAREFGRFAEAAARRYPGVDVWTLWNEPNHPGTCIRSRRRAAARWLRLSTARWSARRSPGCTAVAPATTRSCSASCSRSASRSTGRSATSSR